jgi:hypothetical protein
MKHENNTDTKLIAFYLPQFHPIAENNLWWGDGYTEWTKVTRAKQSFFGHNSPRFAEQLGYYDLRVREIQETQANLAKRFGVYGFCYYYYYFYPGRKLLQLPIERMIANKTIDLPFCICWANENWTRKWDGQAQDILIEQRNDDETVIAFAREVAAMMEDKRYISIFDRPLVLIYRPKNFRNIKHSINLLRTIIFQLIGKEIYIAIPDTYGHGLNELIQGIDAIYEFPTGYDIPNNICNSSFLSLNGSFQGKSALYNDFIDYKIKRTQLSKLNKFPGVTLEWDNTPRRGILANLLLNFSLKAYHQWLCFAINKVKSNHRSERIVFVNAWNEWGEGTYLEPDYRWGDALLRVTQSAIKGENVDHELLSLDAKNNPYENYYSANSKIFRTSKSTKFNFFKSLRHDSQEKSRSRIFQDIAMEYLKKTSGDILDTSGSLSNVHDDYFQKICSKNKYHTSPGWNLLENPLHIHITETLYSLIIAEDTIDECANPNHFLVQIRRILEPNGIFIISCYNKYNIRTLHNQSLEATHPSIFSESGHSLDRGYSYFGLMSLLSKAGLRSLKFLAYSSGSYEGPPIVVDSNLVFSPRINIHTSSDFERQLLYHDHLLALAGC